MRGIDPYSDTWVTASAWARRELNAARETLERLGTNPTDSDVLRGRISALNEFLKLAEPPPPVIESGDTYS